MLGTNLVRELPGQALGNEWMHAAGRVEPTVAKGRRKRSRVPNELAEMGLDARGLTQAHEMRHDGHAVFLVERPAHWSNLELAFFH